MTSGNMVLMGLGREEWYAKALGRAREVLGIPEQERYSVGGVRRAMVARRVRGLAVVGRTLVPFVSSPVNNFWLRGERLSARSYLDCVRARIGGFATRVNQSRGGRVLGDLRCRRCGDDSGRIESLRHIVQSCSATGGARVIRHNRVVHYLLARAREQGFSVYLEPEFLDNISGRVRRPDLVLVKGKKGCVLEVTITWDDAGVMGLAYRRKVGKYLVLGGGSEE